jgi:polyphosphate kinase
MDTGAFVNRELSWLEFNRRVLEEAQDPRVPLLERAKFLAIFSANLDEFFMVRVAALKRRIAARDAAPGFDGLTPVAALAAITARVRELVDAQQRCAREEVRPQLAAEGIVILHPAEVSEEQHRVLDAYFRRTLLPALTPLAAGPGDPLPYLGDRSPCLVVSLRPKPGRALAPRALSVLHLPGQAVPPLVALPGRGGGRRPLVLLEDVIRPRLAWLYPDADVLASHLIRVTRDASLRPVGEAGDLVTSIEAGLRGRRLGAAVRLEYQAGLPADLLAALAAALDLGPADLYQNEVFTAFAALRHLYDAADVPRLRDRPEPAQTVPALGAGDDLWGAIRARDILVHHPYHAFDAVTRFVREAAVDPRVLAIKMTLYRVSPASPIAQALRTAVEHGKEVAVLVELQARFDEEANIRWARALEAVGARVVYGLPGLKTHCKVCLVVRRDADGLRRYCHLATGNYNVRTGGLYGDLGLFTCRPPFGEDLTALFEFLVTSTRPPPFRHLLLAPVDLRDGLVARIRREAAHARAGRPARIIAKMNGLADRQLIEELYAASAAGVRIDLIVRGVCCLRPGVPGLSDNVRVISIVDRYLEHARISYFDNAGAGEYLLASADWMPRNLDRRVEVAFPVLEPVLQDQIRGILHTQLADTVKARRILPDGRSVRIDAPGGLLLRSQERLYDATGPTGVVA